MAKKETISPQIIQKDDMPSPQFLRKDELYLKFINFIKIYMRGYWWQRLSRKTRPQVDRYNGNARRMKLGVS